MIRRLTSLVVALLALTAGLAVAAAPASAEVSTGPFTLTADQHIDSARAVLYMQYDGNLVLYKDDRPVWASGTNGSGPEAVAEFQGDGNLVVYWRRFALWNSGTAGGGARLVLTDDGNLLIVRGFTVVWQTYTGDPPPPGPDPCPYPPYCDDGH
jgi:hypothetical protein